MAAFGAQGLASSADNAPAPEAAAAVSEAPVLPRAGVLVASDEPAVVAFVAVQAALVVDNAAPAERAAMLADPAVAEAAVAASTADSAAAVTADVAASVCAQRLPPR